MKNKCKFLPFLTLFCFFALLFAPNTTYADTKDNIVKKSYLQGLGQCYSLKNGGTEDSYKTGIFGWGTKTNDNGVEMNPNYHQLDGNISISQYYNDFSYRKLFPNEPAVNKIRLPNGWTPENGDSKTNCAHLVNGGHDGFTDTIYDRFGKSDAKVTNSSPITKIDSFMQNMGFKKDNNDITNGRKCFKISFEWQLYNKEDDDNWEVTSSKGTGESNTICANIEDSKVVSFEPIDNDYKYLTIWTDPGGALIFHVIYDPQNADLLCRGHFGDNCAPFGSDYDGGHDEYNSFWLDSSNNNTWDFVKSELEKRVNALKGGKGNFGNASEELFYGSTIGVTGKKLIVTDSVGSNTTWVIDGTRATAADKAIGYLNQGNDIGENYSKVKLTSSQEVVLYQHYITDVAKATISCDVTNPTSTDIAIKWFEKADERKDCYITAYKNDETEYNVLDANRYFTKGVKFDELVAMINALTIKKLTGVDDAITPSQQTGPNNPNNPDQEPEKEPSCFDGGGSLGWILCPLLESLGKTTTFLYEKVIEPFLQVNTQLFRGNVEVRDPNDPDKVIQEKSGSVGAWGIFRDIANIVLVLFFIFILFSQISGFGIDNYGIKKLLPKIIVAAILINLSYIICQIAVDLSNILGFGLKRMMDEMAEGIPMPDGEYSISGNIISTLVPILTVGIAGLAIWSQGLVAAILAVLATIIVGVIGIIFIFALLSVRQAGVILLVVISPVAMACYMLPNTKSLFNKWLKAFQGLLLLYPICGLLIGAGNFASKVLLSTDTENFFIALSAMLINIVPFFFIPTLLKGCFAAMGNIGARISGVGRNISGQAKRSINGSELAQRKRSEQAEMRRMRRAGVKYDKDGNLILTKRGIRQNTKAERTGWRGMSAGAAARLNAERASFSRNATSSNKYVGDGAEGQLELDRMAQEQRDRHSEVDDTILAMQSGNMSYMGDTFGSDGKITGSEQQTVDVHDIGSMQKALTHYLRHSDGNEQNIRALVKTLSQKGDDGRAAVRQSMEDAIKQSGDNGQKLASSGVRAYSAEIMDGFAKDYKENARTTFDFAAGNQAIKDDTDTSTLSMPTTVNAGALKAATVGSIDEGELTRVVDTFNNDQTSTEDKATIARVAYDAINSESGTSIKEKNRARLQELANHHIVKTMDCQALDSNGQPIPGSNHTERISLRGDGKYVNEHGAVVKISSYKIIE